MSSCDLTTTMTLEFRTCGYLRDSTSNSNTLALQKAQVASTRQLSRDATECREFSEVLASQETYYSLGLQQSRNATECQEFPDAAALRKVQDTSWNDYRLPKVEDIPHANGATSAPWRHDATMS
jgi:hypothetical protein